jgi:hypothetical protein
MNAFKILTRKPTGKRPLGTPRQIWGNNNRTDIKEIGVSTMYCIYSLQNSDY